MGIEIKNVSKSFGTFKALEDININIKTGELIALLGPSGSGKTSLLRIIAGLENLDEGAILFDGNHITHINPKERNVGFVFQHYALFRHMTVAENVAYGLKVRPKKVRPSKQIINEKVRELLQLVKLEGFGDRYPSQLSGGQRQRVALARALAVEPKVLLLDEPFGALDAKVRKDLRRWLRKLHDNFHVTSIFVTHDQEEALDVADRVVVMNNGKIEQIGSPEEVYDYPNSPFVYNFLGSVNLFRGRINRGKLIQGDFELEVPEYMNCDAKQAVGYVRPHDLEIETEKVSEDTVLATISHIHMVGPIVQVELKREGFDEFLEAEISKEHFRFLQLSIGKQVYIRPKQLKVFIPEDYSI